MIQVSKVRDYGSTTENAENTEITIKNFKLFSVDSVLSVVKKVLLQSRQPLIF